MNRIRGYPGDPHRYRLYLFPETYQFIDELTDKLKLNLKVYRAGEVRHGPGRHATANCGKQGVEGDENTMTSNKSRADEPGAKELKRRRGLRVCVTWLNPGSRAHLPFSRYPARRV